MQPNNHTQVYQRVLAAIDRNKINQADLALFASWVEARVAIDQRKEEEERKKKEAVPIEVPDFRTVSVGAVVVRSPFWFEMHPDYRKDEIGIVTGIRLFADQIAGTSYWPEVQWAWQPYSAIVDPRIVALRDGPDLPTVIINGNQRYPLNLHEKETNVTGTQPSAYIVTGRVQP